MSRHSFNSVKSRTIIRQIARPYCCCGKTKENSDFSQCRCIASNDLPLEWTFSQNDRDKTSSVVVENNGKDLTFHPIFSTGTAVCKGSQPLEEDRHHYWELRMTTKVYGTAIMVGVATEKTDIFQHETNFVRLIGADSSSWGYSHCGHVVHNEEATGYARPYGCRVWGQGCLVGVHVDRWRGKVEFYLNRKPMGAAFGGLPRSGPLYPMLSSTAAKSGMSLVCSLSYRSDLAFECARVVSKSVKSGIGGMSSLVKSAMRHRPAESAVGSLMPPGLRQFVDNNCWFLFGSKLAAHDDVVDGGNDEASDGDSDDNEVTLAASMVLGHAKRLKAAKKRETPAVADDAMDEDAFYEYEPTSSHLTDVHLDRIDSSGRSWPGPRRPRFSIKRKRDAKPE